MYHLLIESEQTDTDALEIHALCNWSLASICKVPLACPFLLPPPEGSPNEVKGANVILLYHFLLMYTSRRNVEL